MRRLLATALLVLSLPSLLMAGFPFSFWIDPWTPFTPGSLYRWYDASRLGLANGASVTSFTDYSGTPFNAAGTGTYATPTQNGLGVVTFNGSSNSYSIGTITPQLPVTMAVVCAFTNVTSDRPLLAGNSVDSLVIRTPGSANINIWIPNQGTIGNSSSLSTTTSYHLYIVVVTSTTWLIQVDGVTVGSGANAKIPGGVAPTFNMGWDIPDANGHFLGGIGEMAVWQKALGANDLNQAHAFFARKWATP